MGVDEVLLVYGGALMDEVFEAGCGGVYVWSLVCCVAVSWVLVSWCDSQAARWLAAAQNWESVL